MERILAALLKAAHHDPSCYLFRPKNPKTFNSDGTMENPVGYRGFKAATDALAGAGLLEIVPGFKDPRASAFEKGVASRFRATAKLIKLAEDYGISLLDWSSHFAMLPRPKVVSAPVELRADSWKDTKGVKQKGGNMPVDWNHPKVLESVQQVQDITGLIAETDIRPPEWHVGFKRVFAQGDTVGGGYDKGGRLYSGPGDSYQRVDKERRAFMMIDGELTAEVDISACYLTIYYKLMGVPMPLGDPYDVPGVDRVAAKIWTTITLGNDGFHRFWPPKAVKRYAERSTPPGRDLRVDHPFKAVQMAMLEHHPLLKGWKDSPVTWADLQYLESESVIGAVHALAMEHRIPALPLHDAIIVPRSKAGIAKQVLSDCFLEHVGVRPRIAIKDHGAGK